MRDDRYDPHMRRARRRRSSSLRSPGSLAGWGFVAFGVIVVLAIAFSAWYVYGTGDTVTVKVTDKERITESDGDGGVTSKYLVYTDKETFENTDTIFKGKFDSSDVYRKLHEGKTYECEVYGWRVPFMSSYRNIVKCTGA